MQANAPAAEDQGLTIGILVSCRLFGDAYEDAMQTFRYILTAFGGVGLFTTLLIEAP
ncbi:hypothetical protein ABZX51_003829 [Aspergillus tubingensis]